MNANLEEAANVATEYLSSLENLPQEAAFILNEIKYRDEKVASLNDMITKETQRYIRHASKMSGQPLTPKDADMTNSLNALHAEIDALSAEKIVLAERLVKLFERAMARLQHDLQRILKLQGDEPGLPPTQHFLSTLDSTVQQLQTNLRAASVVAETPTVSTPVPPPPQKKRRIRTTTSAGSIKLPSPVPVVPSPYGSSGGGGGGGTTAPRSSLSRQVHPRQSPIRSRRVHASAGPDDEDAEGEEDVEDGGEDGADAEDQELYCYCQKLSYGEMIACDNDGCRFQWFHLSCINVKPGSSLPDVWYCEECKAKLGIQETFTPAPPAAAAAVAATGGRKGRKKQ